MKRVAEPSSTRHGQGEEVMRGLLTLQEFSSQTGIKLTTLRNWRDTKKYLEIFVRFGGLLLVDIHEFGRIVERQKTAAKREAEKLKRLRDS